MPDELEDDVVVSERRPVVVVLVVLGLVGLAICSVLAGAALSWVSSCCESADEADPTPTVVGLLLAAAAGIASYGLWTGALPRRALLAITLVFPVVFIIASFSSVDFQSLAPFAVIGWLAFWWFLRRPQVDQWLRD